MEPADEELLELMPRQLRDDLATVARMAAHGAGPDVTPELFEASLAAGALQFVRAVLARYGHQPAPPAEGEGLPSDQEIADVFSQGCRDFSCSYEPPFLGGARAILARWGRPAPVPAPPAEGEVGELIEGLNLISDGMDAMGHESDSWFVARAAGLLAQRHPTPVPLSERLPGPEDCDGEGTCWAWNRTAHTWGLFRLDPAVHSHWLPATALPLPAGEVQP